jgi:hypothetical protein
MKKMIYNAIHWRTFVIAVILAPLTWGICLGQATADYNWQIKTNVTGFLSNAISLEIEKPFSNGFAATLQGGAIVNVLDPQPEHVFEGYFFRLGAKKYLFQKNEGNNNTGLALKAELHYSHWRDYYTSIRGNVGNRWENSIGAMATISYSQTLGKCFFIEPYVGIGYIPTWESYTYDNDIEPFETVEVKWKKVTQPERRFNYFSHFSLSGALVFSPGVSLGLRF